MDERSTETGIDEARRARIERDAAIEVAAIASVDSALADREADVERSQRIAAEHQNDVLKEDVRAAKTWAAQSAVARGTTERIAEANASEARSSTVGLMVLLAVIVIGAAWGLIWFANQQNQQAATPPTINRTTIVNPPTVSSSPSMPVMPSEPASAPVINNYPAAPASSTISPTTPNGTSATSGNTPSTTITNSSGSASPTSPNTTNRSTYSSTGPDASQTTTTTTTSTPNGAAASDTTTSP